MWLCSVNAEPYLMLPGANLFISSSDVTSPADASGTNVISCQPISAVHGYSTAAKGWNYLRRILAGLPLE